MIFGVMDFEIKKMARIPLSTYRSSTCTSRTRCASRASRTLNRKIEMKNKHALANVGIKKTNKNKNNVTGSHVSPMCCDKPPFDRWWIHETNTHNKFAVMWFIVN